ncbi:FprA family A-type flavoprotein [Promethearchaeum syntrophicum]|uniref:FprA family A-type flavoprotein n=1 Tax=Promethearchaeum syntrophicum TaxID=2594042 RepID=A0A5B9D8B7_9ARCH|nr:FprA family A-type flavoprotein [Candidatus Prometheoarchaeum syntrophicum]QEE15303.1 Type A flavoprotein FprA [Candidatus Prometheoarchaeum syntrophicum]
MKATEITDGIYWIGANISTNDLFEGLWPIPNGVTINSYVVRGDKIAIIDLVRDWGGAQSNLIDELNSIGISIKDVDYFIVNHLEPDHTGDLRGFNELSGKAEIITSTKGKPLVEAFYGITENVKAVSSGDTLDLGQGKVLTFYDIPNVHWPETMATFESSTETLFPCDAFGSFGALKGSLFDDENSEEDHLFYENESLRYYANIVGPFSNFVLKAIDALGPLDIKIIAPSHGLVWRGNPRTIVNRYKTYANYMNDYAEPKITVIWGSMYSNTEKMLRSVLKGIASEGVHVKIFRVPEDDKSYILASAWESAGLVFGMPTYEYKMYPPMQDLISLLAKKHVWNKKVFRFGSFGWSGGAQKHFDQMTEKLKWDCLEPLEFQGGPKDEDLDKGFEMGKKFAQEIKKIPKKL